LLEGKETGKKEEKSRGDLQCARPRGKRNEKKGDAFQQEKTFLSKKPTKVKREGKRGRKLSKEQ